MTFQAALDNAKPPGLIHSSGDFGPWNPDEPGDTPVSGKYTFRDANLGVFPGITGILASDGQYHGELDRIEVEGTTDVPNFSLTNAGHPMHLQTQFSATVDGTNGNTDLHPVHATLGKSTFDVSGSIERGALETHKEIALHATAGKTGLEDFLRLAVNSPKPPMTGRIAFNTTVKIPPGKRSGYRAVAAGWHFPSRWGPVHQPGCRSKNREPQPSCQGRTGCHRNRRHNSRI